MNRVLTYRRVFVFWVPLAATWLMMASEGPFLAAVIARLVDPKYNLAAYGVAFSFALLVEAPVIMMMSASTALVRDKASYIKLRNFTYALNALITGVMLIGLTPQVFNWLVMGVIGLPENVARLTHLALIVLIPWPGAIGYRRFLHGVLIRSNLTRRVAYTTMIRLSTMASTALVLFWFTNLQGAVVGAAALSAGVSLEAIAARFLAHGVIKRLLSGEDSDTSRQTTMSYASIAKFYYPLALTSLIALGAHPIIAFFMGKSRFAVDSLAVLPVTISLAFIFISLALSYQEVVITFMGERGENYATLKKFAGILAIGVFAAMSIIAYTPASRLWLEQVAGLSPELAAFATKPLKILVFVPVFSVWLCFQRSFLVSVHRTGHITIATVVEVSILVVTLFCAIRYLDFVGIIAAVIALAFGRLCANLYLFSICQRILRGL